MTSLIACSNSKLVTQHLPACITSRRASHSAWSSQSHEINVSVYDSIISDVRLDCGDCVSEPNPTNSELSSGFYKLIFTLVLQSEARFTCQLSELESTFSNFLVFML